MTAQLTLGYQPAAGAVFSPCRRYRYRLWRDWGGTGGRALFVMLNPSTADDTTNDPTIRRCIAFARSWGCRGIEVANLFALRSPYPRDLRESADPVGPGNDQAIRDAARACDVVIAAWGVHGAYLGRDDRVREILADGRREVRCFGTTKDGHPRHPLYLRADAVLQAFGLEAA